MNLGDLELKRKNWRKALEYYDQSINIMKKSNNHYGECMLLIKICDASLKSGSYNQEEDKYVELLGLAEKISKRHSYIDLSSLVSLIKARINLNAGVYNKSAQLFIEAFEYAKRFNVYFLKSILLGFAEEKLLDQFPDSHTGRYSVEAWISSATLAH